MTLREICDGVALPRTITKANLRAGNRIIRQIEKRLPTMRKYRPPGFVDFRSPRESYADFRAGLYLLVTPSVKARKCQLKAMFGSRDGARKGRAELRSIGIIAVVSQGSGYIWGVKFKLPFDWKMPRST